MASFHNEKQAPCVKTVYTTATQNGMSFSFWSSTQGATSAVAHDNPLNIFTGNSGTYGTPETHPSGAPDVVGTTPDGSFDTATNAGEISSNSPSQFMVETWIYADATLAGSQLEDNNSNYTERFAVYAGASGENVELVYERNTDTTAGDTSMGVFYTLQEGWNYVKILSSNDAFLHGINLRVDNQGDNNFANIDPSIIYQELPEYTCTEVDCDYVLQPGEFDCVLDIPKDIGDQVTDPFSPELVVYVNGTDPNTATIFDESTPPTTHDPLLIENDNYIYVGSDGSTWTWDGTQYISYTAPNNTEWNFQGTATDAGGDKTSAIQRTGGVNIGFGSDVAPRNFSVGVNHTMTGINSTTVGANNVVSGQSSLVNGSGNNVASNITFVTGQQHNVSATAHNNSIHGLGITSNGNANFAWSANLNQLTTDHFGAFTLNSSGTGGTLATNANYRFRTKFTNGYQLYTNAANSTGARMLGGASAWSAVSDERVKKDIVNISYGLDEIMKLNPVSFKRKTSEELGQGPAIDDETGEVVIEDYATELGFIAQEVKDVLPEAVDTPEESGDDLYSLRTESIIPVLVKAIHELKEEIEKLKSSVK